MPRSAHSCCYELLVRPNQVVKPSSALRSLNPDHLTRAIEHGDTPYDEPPPHRHLI